MSLDERTEEVLETLWERLEEGKTGEEQPSREDLEALAAEGLVRGEGEGLAFTERGREEARQVIRRHRLAERLMSDVVDTSRADMEAAACQMEHALRRGVEERVCELLGHPETCPHGRPIPPGPCCEKARAEGERYVAPLAHLRPGEEGTVAYLKTQDSKKLQKLMAMGVRPGSRLKVEQAFPAYVFTVGFSRFAVDAEMAGLIMVRREPGAPGGRRRRRWGLRFGA
ncbi:metal-dependent transcriptional regulator [Deferrisoma sp.]